MTANGLLGELKAWSGLAAPAPASAKPMPSSALPGAPMQADGSTIGAILDVSDRVIGETGRRSHVFDWLGSAGGGDRLAVDAYYPAHQLVVVCQEQHEPHHALWPGLIQAHGLRLFMVRLDDYRGDSGLAYSRLIGELRLVSDSPASAAAAPLPTAPLPLPTARMPLPPARMPPLASPTPPLAPPTPPSAAPPRRSASGAFQPLRAAVHRFTAAPQPFVLPLEPGPEAPPVAAPQPASPQPFVLAPPPVPVALQQYLTGPSSAPPAPPRAAAAPPPVTPPPPPSMSSVLQHYLPNAPGTSERFVATPLPFDRAAPALEPVLASAVIEPEHEPGRRRVGQRQAEAAARAARFVEARAASSEDRSGGRAGVLSAWRTAFTQPQVAGTGSTQSQFAPAVAAMGAAVPGWPSMPDHDPLPPSRARARAEAVERALAHVRSTPGPFRHQPPQEHVAMDGDDMALGVIVAIILMVEFVLGALLTFAGGPPVLGLGLLLDGAARALGTIMASRVGAEYGSGWRWLCALIGSPAVIAFTFKRDGTLIDSDLAPLAAPMAVIAVLVLLVGLAALPAGV